MKENPSRRIADDKAASSEEISDAIEGLTTAQLLRLQGYAAGMVGKLYRRAMGRNGEDLLQDAFMATLDGRRRWNKANVDFVGHLLGVIKSMVSHLGEQFDPNEARLECETTPAADGSLYQGPLTLAPSRAPDAECEAIAKQKLERTKALFSQDDLLTNVLECMMMGFKGHETQEILGISKTQYESAVRRIHRTIEGTKYD